MPIRRGVSGNDVDHQPSAVQGVHHIVDRACWRAGFWAWCVLVAVAPLAAEEGLLEGEPYDLVTIATEREGEVVKKVLPVDLPGRRLPENPSPNERLQIFLFDSPNESYQVAWRNIVKLQLFEELVLASARKKVEKDQFDEAYQLYAYLLKNRGDLPGLQVSIGRFLLKNAAASYRAGRFDEAFGMLLELNERQPGYSRLPQAFDRVVEKLVSQYVAAENYRAARALLRRVAMALPGRPLPVVERWQTQWSQNAVELLANARLYFRSEAFDLARKASQQALTIWPDLVEARELIGEIYRRHPYTVVAVSLPFVVSSANPLKDWATRRARPLVDRSLVEFAGYGSDGGQYDCPLGEVSYDEAGPRLSIRLAARPEDDHPRRLLTGYDLARALMARAKPGHDGYSATWALLLRGLSVDGVYEVAADLTQPHVRPEALLEISLTEITPISGEEIAAASASPYSVVHRTHKESIGKIPYTEEVRYRRREIDFVPVSRQPREIIEKTFDKPGSAIAALKRGVVDVVDRVEPWELASLENAAGVEVKQYALPTVHVLLVNTARPLLESREFRRALVYGIHRQAILDYLFAGWASDKSSTVLSGPFPASVSYDDPVGYASDDRVKPRPYEPRLALVLAAVARDKITQRAKEEHRRIHDLEAPLMLVHPPESVARRACEEIQRQLGLVGIPVNLREDLVDGSDEEYDLRYAELALWEPVVDAQQLLGEGGLAGHVSPYMQLALEKLGRATTWKQVRKNLHEIHGITHDELAVIPLWQTNNYFAHRSNLRGVDEHPVTLYQHVNQWELTSDEPR